MAKSAEQMKDGNDRTTPMGLFNLAEAYRLSAMRLQANPGKLATLRARCVSCTIMRSNFI
jgi:hypothetical protein